MEIVIGLVLFILVSMAYSLIRVSKDDKEGEE